MLSECGCKPGTYENGWQEKRSEACVRAEREAFARAIRVAHYMATVARMPDAEEIARVRAYYAEKDQKGTP